MAAKFKITPEVRDVLSRSKITPKGGAFELLLPEQLERKLYAQTFKVIEGAGGTWDKKLRVHRFDTDPRTVLDLAVETGVAVNQQQAFQAFYTPPEVADRMADLLQLPLLSSVRILEPSAGEGALVDAVRRTVQKNGGPLPVFDCFEIDPKARPVLRQKAVNVHEVDFLTQSAALLHGVSFHRVIMNPPFRGQADIDHVTHAFRYLRIGGILVAIMSPSTDFRETKKTQAFRKLCDNNDMMSWPLPRGTFADTNIETRLFRITRLT